MTSVCVHCKKVFNSQIASRFCCEGCQTVYFLLHERGLEKFYDLRSHLQSFRSALPAFNVRQDYSYLDSEEFLKIYSWKDIATSSDRWMDFYLEGVHCAACIWLTEKVAEFVDHVRSIRLNLETSVATVKVSEKGSFSAVADEFIKMGYRPSPVRREQYRELRKRENRILLMQIGIAGACSGNIMLLAISIYAGATGTLAQYFQWISFFLYLPVLGFSAIPLLKGAFRAIKARQTSIDIPIAFGILIGTGASIVNLFLGFEQVYFDSLSALIFLLLSSRFILRKVNALADIQSQFLQSIVPRFVRRWNPLEKKFEQIHVEALYPNDEILVSENETIGADGIVIQGTSTLNTALLTGEALPVLVEEGKSVFAGTENIQSPIHIRVQAVGESTRVGRILKSLEEVLGQRSSTLHFADQISRVFIFLVMCISLGLLFWGIFEGWHRGLNRALALAIVACPCTFVLVTPLTFCLALRNLMKRGILVKGSSVLEKLAHAQTIFFDKTGTLTSGQFTVCDWSSFETELDQKVTENAIYALEKESQHPLALAICNFFAEKNNEWLMQSIISREELIGVGVKGKIGECSYEIRRTVNAKRGTEVSVFKNGKHVGNFLFRDEILPFVKKTIDTLRKMGLISWVLSGDTFISVEKLAIEVGLDSNHCVAEATPESKAFILRQNPLGIMVGDGANDAIAMATANVGIAVKSKMELCMKASQVYLLGRNVDTLPALIVVSRETLKVVYRNFIFSLVYNLVAGIGAFMGKINPLFAAVLMPMSVLFTTLSAVIGTKKMRISLKDLNS